MCQAESPCLIPGTWSNFCILLTILFVSNSVPTNVQFPSGMLHPSFILCEDFTWELECWCWEPQCYCLVPNHFLSTPSPKHSFLNVNSKIIRSPLPNLSCDDIFFAVLFFSGQEWQITNALGVVGAQVPIPPGGDHLCLRQPLAKVTVLSSLRSLCVRLYSFIYFFSDPNWNSLVLLISSGSKWFFSAHMSRLAQIQQILTACSWT